MVGLSPVAAAERSFSPEVVSRIAAELSSRQVDPANEGVRGFGGVFRYSAPAVPLIISKEGFGSSVLLQAAGASGYVITNYHVVAPPFIDADGPYVIVLFYNPGLARDVFDRERIARCLAGRDQTPWCDVLKEATRPGTVVLVDADRDLALLVVRDVPIGVQPIPLGGLADANPGDEVAVIGHPLGFLWSLTTGIVSGVRSNYPISSSAGASTVTVVQTQTPINPGNSGGPLLSSSGRVLGVMFGVAQVPVRIPTGAPPVGVPSQGVNLAIGINEVRDFVTRATTK
jgi:S1-C subfamily serine protease